MDILGIDISKRTLDAALLVGGRTRHATFPNTEAGFEQLLAWLAKHRPDPAAPLHACMEATGNWGLNLGDFLHGRGVRVSIVNPARIKAYGESELARNKTDRLDAALIARFCRAQMPPAWSPPAAHLRELRELVRRCDALKAARVQELNRRKSGFASPAVARSLADPGATGAWSHRHRVAGPADRGSGGRGTPAHQRRPRVEQESGLAARHHRLRRA